MNGYASIVVRIFLKLNTYFKNNNNNIYKKVRCLSFIDVLHLRFKLWQQVSLQADTIIGEKKCHTQK